MTLGLPPFNEARCILCGHRVEYRGRKPRKLEWFDWPAEIIGRCRAISRGAHWPKYFENGIFYY